MVITEKIKLLNQPCRSNPNMPWKKQTIKVSRLKGRRLHIQQLRPSLHLKYNDRPGATKNITEPTTIKNKKPWYLDLFDPFDTQPV